MVKRYAWERSERATGVPVRDVATRLALPMTLEGDVVLGVAAVQALAEIHPPDLERRLAPLRDKTARAEVRRVAEAALAEPGHCR